MKNKMPYSLPAGYMESLPERLSAIPACTAVSCRRSAFKPVLAFACVLAAAFVIGGTLIRRSASPASSQEEEIVEYLIDSGTTLAQICYCIDGE